MRLGEDRTGRTAPRRTPEERVAEVEKPAESVDRIILAAVPERVIARVVGILAAGAGKSVEVFVGAAAHVEWREAGDVDNEGGDVGVRQIAVWGVGRQAREDEFRIDDDVEIPSAVIEVVKDDFDTDRAGAVAWL